VQVLHVSEETRGKTQRQIDEDLALTTHDFDPRTELRNSHQNFLAACFHLFEHPFQYDIDISIHLIIQLQRSSLQDQKQFFFFKSLPVQIGYLSYLQESFELHNQEQLFLFKS